MFQKLLDEWFESEGKRWLPDNMVVGRAAVREFADWLDTRSPTLREAGGDTCPDCKGKGIVVGADDALFQCRRCKGSGHV